MRTVFGVLAVTFALILMVTLGPHVLPDKGPFPDTFFGGGVIAGRPSIRGQTCAILASPARFEGRDVELVGMILLDRADLRLRGDCPGRAGAPAELSTDWCASTPIDPSHGIAKRFVVSGRIVLEGGAPPKWRLNALECREHAVPRPSAQSHS